MVTWSQIQGLQKMILNLHLGAKGRLKYLKQPHKSVIEVKTDLDVI